MSCITTYTVFTGGPATPPPLGHPQNNSPLDKYFKTLAQLPHLTFIVGPI